MTYKLIKEESRSITISGKRNSVEGTVKKTLITNDKVILLFSPDNVQNDTNVWSFSITGNKLWEIESAEYPNGHSIVTSIYVEKNKLMVYRFCGVEEEIDVNTGTIISSEFIR